MRVAIDATALVLSSGGLARYTAELSRALAEHIDDEFTLLRQTLVGGSHRAGLRATIAIVPSYESGGGNPSKLVLSV